MKLSPKSKPFRAQAYRGHDKASNWLECAYRFRVQAKRKLIVDTTGVHGGGKIQDLDR